MNILIVDYAFLFISLTFISKIIKSVVACRIAVHVDSNEIQDVASLLKKFRCQNLELVRQSIFTWSYMYGRLQELFRKRPRSVFCASIIL